MTSEKPLFIIYIYYYYHYYYTTTIFIITIIMVYHLKASQNATKKQAGTKVGPDQLGPPVWVGSTRTNLDRIKK